MSGVFKVSYDRIWDDEKRTTAVGTAEVNKTISARDAEAAIAKARREAAKEWRHYVDDDGDETREKYWVTDIVVFSVEKVAELDLA